MHIGSAHRGSTPPVGLRMQSRRLLCKAVEETAGVAAGVETLVAAILVVQAFLAKMITKQVRTDFLYFWDWPLVPKTCSPLFFLAQAYCFHDVFFFFLLFGFLLIEISHFWHFLPKNFWAGPAQVELDAENSQVFFFTFLL